MIGIKYTIINEDGLAVCINDHTNPNKVYALQAYPQFEVNIKNSEINRDGQHGVWDFHSYYGSRLINFSGVIVADTEAEVEQMKQQILRVVKLPTQPTPTRSGVVKIKWTDLDGASWEVEAKLVRDVLFNRDIGRQQVMSFNLSFKATDPYIYSQNITSQVGIRGYIQTGGDVPLELPATIGLTYKNKLKVVNDGVAYAHTLIRFYGEDQQVINNPRVLNLTTGEECRLNLALADETEWVEVDSKTGTVVNQDGDDVSGDLDTGSTFVLLQTGENELAYISDEDPAITFLPAEAFWTVKFRNTKI